MSRRGDERAVTVQIGAVLLLAIVFAALALYQVNAVPAENERVEFGHNQAVHDELQELRNAIRNVGSGGGTQSTAVTLGTQYPSRTVAANPPPATGRLETTETATVSIDAAVDPDAEYEGDPGNLTGDHGTTTLVYEPNYAEYGSAPATRIEHGFAFNDFGDAQVSLTEQPLLSDGTIRLVVLEGELSASGSGAVALDPTALSGPSDPVPIEPADGNERVTLSVPTAAPTAWNDSIGASFDDGVSDARVTGYDGATGRVTIELADDEYELQVARVGLGDGGTASDEYEVHRASGSDGPGPAYRVRWEDPSGQSGTVDEDCDADACVVRGDSVELTMSTDGTAAGAGVEYAVNDTSVGALSRTEGRTDDDGTHTTTFEVGRNADEGETVIVYTSSGSDGDRIELEIANEARFDVEITGTNEPVDAGEPLEVTAAITSRDDAAGTQNVTLDIGDGVGAVDVETVELAPGASETVTLTWETTEADAGTYEVTVAGDDGRDRRTVDVDARSGPTASLDAATHETETLWFWRVHHVTVDWSATDDDLSGGSVNEVRLYDASGDLVETESISPSGTSDDGRVEFTNVGADPDGWTAEVVVSDAHDLRDSDTEPVA